MLTRVLLTLILITTTYSLPAYTAEPSVDLDKFVIQINQEFENFLATKCNEPRKKLCAAMRGFHLGKIPQSFIMMQPYYLGSIHSLRADFKYSMDYPSHNALLMLKHSKIGTEARFEQLKVESTEEKILIDNAKKQMLLKKNFEKSALVDYFRNLTSQGGFSKCSTTINSILCTSELSNFSVLLIREYNGNLYTVALGEMQFMKDSYDSVLGLFISEYILR